MASIYKKTRSPFWYCEWIDNAGVRSPRGLNRQTALVYAGWRTSDAARKTGMRQAKHNTALFEVKALSTIMREAVARELAPANPCLQLGMKRERAKIKPEITAEE